MTELTAEELLKYTSLLRNALPNWEASAETKEMIIGLAGFNEEEYNEFINKFKDYYLNGNGKDKILHCSWEEQIKFWLKQRIEWQHEAKLKKAKINSSAMLQIQINEIDLDVLITKLKILFPDNISINVYQFSNEKK